MWIPARLSDEQEWFMEQREVPEEDRVEVRKMIEYLRWKQLRRGGGCGPMRPEMEAWLLGRDK